MGSRKIRSKIITMLLHINSCSSFSLNYQTLQDQHDGCTQMFKSPWTPKNGSARRSQSSNKNFTKKNFTKSSIQSSLFNFTNKSENIKNIIKRNYKPLINRSSSVPSASSQDDKHITATSFVDFFFKKLDAFYRLCRPYTWTGTIVGIISSSFLPVQSLGDITPIFFIEVLKPIAPTIMMNVFVTAVNQLSDIEIDKVNKPNLPLASGDFSIGEGVAIAVIATQLSLGMGIMLRSPPIIIALIVRWIVGAAYSINLPLLRWKGSPLMSVVTIMILNGILLQLPSFIHTQKYVLGRPLAFTKPLVFAAAFMGVFNIVLTFAKDIPDVEGDREFGCRTVPVILGKETVFAICVNTMLISYGCAVLVGASSASTLCKFVTIISHSSMGLLLWRKVRTIDLSDTKSTYSFFIFLLKLYSAEFFLMHFVR